MTLRLVASLTVGEIARAFRAGEATIAQRIVRAKRTLGEAHVPFEMPVGAAYVERLPSVLEVIYLVFNEGYAASRGDELLRPEFCAEAMRLGRVLSARLPQEGEVHGLLALMELQASRLRARVDASGDPVLLTEQRLLLKLGRRADARRAFQRAAALATNTREQTLLLRRAQDASASQA